VGKSSGRRASGVLWAFARSEQASARVEITPPELLAELVADSRGAVLSSPHFGPFDAAAATARTLPAGTELAVVTDENAIGQTLHRIRTRMGLTVIPADAPPHQVLRVLHRDGIVVARADLHRPGMRSHVVDLLDAKCILPGEPAAIARMGRAPLVPFATYPDGARRWRIELGTPIDPPRAPGRTRGGAAGHPGARRRLYCRPASQPRTVGCDRPDPMAGHERPEPRGPMIIGTGDRHSPARGTGRGGFGPGRTARV
jgi:predicted LPLAT superfamily acyltransferase